MCSRRRSGNLVRDVVVRVASGWRAAQVDRRGGREQADDVRIEVFRQPPRFARARAGLHAGAGLLVFFLPALAAADGKITVIDAARVITVSGEEFAPGQIVIEDGKITLVGKNLDVPRSARRVDARGETVMPGLILARTRFGLENYPREGVHADARALAELHADTFDGTPLLSAGIVAAAFVPGGTGFPGQAAVVRPPHGGGLDVLREGAYLPVSFLQNGRDRGVITQAFDRAKKEIEKADKARAEWEKKQEEARKLAEAEAKKNGKPAEVKTPEEKAPEKKPPEKTPAENKPAGKEAAPKFEPVELPPELAPLVAILRKDENALPLLFEISAAGNLVHLDAVLEEFEELALEKHRNVQFVPSNNPRQEQRPLVAPLGERKATVVTVPLIVNLANTSNLLNLPAELERSGCTLIFIPPVDSQIEYQRLLSRVADLVRAGLSREAGLKALTLHPATFLGIEDRCGAIEKDRSADLVFLDGDPFAAATHATRTMIAGEWVWEEERPE